MSENQCKHVVGDVFELLAQAEDDTPSAPPGGDDGQTGESEPGHAAGTAGQPRSWQRAAVVLFGGVALAALGLAGFLGWRLHQADTTAAAGRSALEAARSYALTLTTLDAKTIDSNYIRALDGATGDFRDAYSQGSAQLRQVLIDNNVSGRGVVVDAAVKSATNTRVEVLLFVDQSVTNTVRSEPRIDRIRVQMTMKLVDNHWLASDVVLA